eukprot:tig00020951_g16462.t1
MGIYGQPEVYKRLRETARASVIDADDVAWAWYGEFARLKHALLAKGDLVKREVRGGGGEKGGGRGREEGEKVGGGE